MALPFALEKQVAITAVLRACRLTASVFNNLVTAETVTKNDKSPVTVADYAAQAVINTVLTHAFPSDPIVGEEDAADLRSPSSSDLRKRVCQLANDVLAAPPGDGEREEWGLGRERSEDELMDAIDRGNYAGGRTGRMWALDPIDGTKGFLRGGQYAVCLALIVDSEVQLGVMGCPNLPSFPPSPSPSPPGCLFLAIRSQGSFSRPISSPNPTWTRLQMPPFAPSEYQLLESLESAHSSHGFSESLSAKLGITRPPIRMDSQAKYCALARGEGTVYLRMPTGVGYREKIWDHASGTLLIQEASGLVTDSRGLPLDFGLGRTLGENFGVVAAGKEVHGRVLEAVRQVKAEEGEGK